jgi:putative acetyltransferase
MPEVQLIRTNSTNRNFLSLVSELEADLWERYPLIHQNYAKLNIIPEDALVVLLYEDTEPTACGCLKTHGNGTYELKRVFVRRAHRRKGYSKQVLAELETWARERHCTRIVLETGIAQPEAASLYANAGYSRIENYGEYKGNPNSICMEKLLKA